MREFENFLLGRRITRTASETRHSFALPDIDAPPPPPPAPEPEPEPEPEGPSLEDLLAEARAQGYRDGLDDGAAKGLEEAKQLAETRIGDLLARINESLARGEAEARSLADRHAESIARSVLHTLDAALPLAASRVGADLITRTAQSLRAVLDDRPEARLLVCPEMAETIAARLPHWTVEPDPAMPPGDARIAWRGGAITLDLAARRRAIRAVLESLDLAEPEEAA